MEHFFVEFRLYAMVALGIGLVIFVHELGHFLAARWCGVRVEVFSLGFGPRVFGWRRSGTMYQLSLVPLGGYVKMAGEEGLEAGRAPQPDELPAKSVGQRFLIYSGGVIMNMVFALIVFPLILMAGVPFPEPIVHAVPGGPAWSAGIESGTRVVSVNGNPVYAFHHIVNEVALSSPEGLDLVVLPPGSTTPRSLHLVPVYEKEMGFYAIGVGQDSDPLARVEITPGAPAAAAGIRNDDRVIAVEGGIEGLPVLEQLREVMQAGNSVTVRLRRDDGSEYGATIEPRAGANPPKLLGVMPILDRIVAVRPTPLVAATGLRKDDRILSVGDKRIELGFDFLRALRRIETGADDASRTLKMRVEREGREVELTGPVLKPGDAIALDRDIAVQHDKESTRIVVMPDSAAFAAGIRTGDRITKIDDEEAVRYSDILDAVRKVDGGKALALTLERGAGDGRETFTAQVAPAPLPQPEYGLNAREATYIYKASGPVDAVKVGLASSWKLVQESWLTLKRILLGSVSGSNIGGIITIGVVSHNWAEQGIARLLFFLCMLSVNLAFLNVLPIPVLDGGHLFFLLVEKIKGSPVSERVLGYSQLVGIVLIVSLMIYVTYNDVVRWILK